MLVSLGPPEEVLTMANTEEEERPLSDMEEDTTVVDMEEDTTVVDMEEETTVVDMEEETTVAEECHGHDKMKEAKIRRVRRPCPIPECKGALVKNMWNHIFQTHKKQGRYTSKLL